ncbi:hypothetical protein PZB75_01115 [Streptomyces sp. AM 4-1-1]|uniref:hypothetical protein n=1 Tax=Streptomyces sp. AM 4-1-1 TaxID=3028710 RepID=UPI0023B9F9FC|nr:hypothetical protein [Streptomyces sp. AM 4-1-1]WEH32102.1 hypothetical protein PZB75_01115 [Streptomyces sp. AM 4-1-1]
MTTTDTGHPAVGHGSGRITVNTVTGTAPTDPLVAETLDKDLQRRLSSPGP